MTIILHDDFAQVLFPPLDRVSNNIFDSHQITPLKTVGIVAKIHF